MLHLSEQSESLWQEIPKINYSPLTEDLDCDVCIVGGGITGLTVAYHCLQQGHRVVVIDRDQMAAHETAHTSAHLSNALDDTYQTLRKMHGMNGMRLAYDSHTQAIDRIEEIVFENSIDCDFQRVSGYLFLDAETPRNFLEKELTCVHEAGGENVELFENAQPGSFQLGPALHYPRQAQFHPLKYTFGLAQAVERLGGKIFAQTPAVGIRGGKEARVKTSRGNVIRCQSIVVATNTPVNDVVTMHTKIAAYRSYLIAVRLKKNWLEPALLWDTASPYHYIRSINRENGEQILLIGGADHRTGQAAHPEDRYNDLRAWTRDFLMHEPEIIAKWSGQIIEPVDALGYIGRNPGDAENVFIVTGDSGHGLTHGTIAGIMLPDLIEKKTHAWQELYDPSRLKIRGLEQYVEENFRTARQYSDWLSSGDLDSTADISCGHGAVIRNGLNKIAAYRDEHGILHTFSAVCPHLKGLVHWNEAESTWDCPCHGSRFTRTGKVLNGPAIEGLSPVETGETQRPQLIESQTPPPPPFSPGLDFT